MGKGKKKKAQNIVNSGDLLDMAVVSIKQFRRVTKQIGKLSTGQKLVGGLTLLAAGLTYLARQQASSPPIAARPATPPLPPPAEAPSALASPKSNLRHRKKAGDD